MIIDEQRSGNASATLIIPAYNEERGLAAVLGRLESDPIDGLEVVVVGDGSNDDTAAVARARGVRLLRHDVNRGKGAAVQTALAAASAPNLVIIDADDTYPTSAIGAHGAAQRRVAHSIRCRPGVSKLRPMRDGWVILRTIVSLGWAGARNTAGVLEAD